MAVADSIDSGRVATLKMLIRDNAELYELARSTGNLRDAKALSVEIRAAWAELDELDPKPVVKPTTALDELRSRREARKTG